MKLFCAFKAGKFKRLSHYQKFLIGNVFTFLCTKTTAAATFNFLLLLKGYILMECASTRIKCNLFKWSSLFVKCNTNSKIIPNACKNFPYLSMIQCLFFTMHIILFVILQDFIILFQYNYNIHYEKTEVCSLCFN